MADSILDLGGYSLLSLDYDKSAGIGFRAETSRTIIRQPGGVNDAYYFSDAQPLRFSVPFVGMEIAEVYAILALFYAQKGRYTPFWLAAQIRTVEPMTTFSTTTVQIRPTSWPSAYKGHERLFLKLDNGDRIVRKITAVNAGAAPGDPDIMSLNSSVGRPITVAEIVEASILLFGRFDTDDVEVAYLTSGVAEATVEFIELPEEYPA